MMHLQPTDNWSNYLHSDCMSTPDVQTRLSHGAASEEGMFSPLPPDSPSRIPHRFNNAGPLLSFNRRISEGASTNGGAADVDAPYGRQPGLLAAHGGGGSRRAANPILSMRRRQTDFAGGMPMQMQMTQQSFSSPAQGGQFRLSLPSLAPGCKTPDQASSTYQPTDSDPAQHSRLLSTLPLSPTRTQPPGHAGTSHRARLCPSTALLCGSPATSGYSPMKPPPADSDDGLFLANPLTAQARSTLLTSQPPSIAKSLVSPKARPPPVSPTKALEPRGQEHQQRQLQQQQSVTQRPASASKDDAEPHYDLGADFEAEAAKQRRLSSAFYIVTPAGQEKALDGMAPIAADVAEHADDEDEYEDKEEQDWHPKEGLLHWLDVTVAVMKSKGRVA